MTPTAQHWATDVVGKPWRPGEAGPEAFYCWGLVCWVYDTQRGIDLPRINFSNDVDNTDLIRRLAKQHDYSFANAPPHEWDIVIMRNGKRRHAGVAIRANGTLGLLHADGCMNAGVPVGQVIFCKFNDVTLHQYGQMEFWRARCATDE